MAQAADNTAMRGEAVGKLFRAVSFPAPKEAAKLVLPLLAMILAAAVDAASPDIYPEGYVERCYPLFMKASIAVYLVCLALSMWFEPVRRRFLKWYGLIIFGNLALCAYTLATVKSGALELPYFPSADKVIDAVFGNLDRTLLDLRCSLTLLLEGMLVGGILGFIWGSLMGYSEAFDYWLNPIIKIIGPVPGIAWIVVALILCPTNRIASIVIVASTTWFPLSVNLSGGIRSVPKTYIEHAQTLGASHFYIMRHVVYPYALPNIFTGLFMACCFSLTSLVAAEGLGVESGLGWRIGWAQSYLSFDVIYGTAIVFILMAFTLITILFMFQKRFMKWSKEGIQW